MCTRKRDFYDVHGGSVLRTWGLILCQGCHLGGWGDWILGWQGYSREHFCQARNFKWLHLKFMCLRHFCLMVVVFWNLILQYKLMIRGFLSLLLIVMNDMKTIFLSGKFLQFYAPFLLFSCATSSQAHTESIRIITMGSMKFLFVMQTFDWFFWLFTESSQLELGPHPCVTARIAESSWSRHKLGGSLRQGLAYIVICYFILFPHEVSMFPSINIAASLQYHDFGDMWVSADMHLKILFHIVSQQQGARHRRLV